MKRTRGGKWVYSSGKEKKKGISGARLPNRHDPYSVPFVVHPYSIFFRLRARSRLTMAGCHSKKNPLTKSDPSSPSFSTPRAPLGEPYC